MRAFVVFLAHLPALLAFIISILSFIYIFIQKAVTETFDKNIPTSPNAEAVFELIKNIRSEIMNKETEMVSLLRSEIKNKDTEMESLFRTIPKMSMYGIVLSQLIRIPWIAFRSLLETTTIRKFEIDIVSS